MVNRPNFKEESKRIDTMSKEEIKNFLIENRHNFLDEFLLRFYVKYMYYDDEFVFNKKFYNYNIRPDIVLKKEKIVIEYDGPTHFTNNETVLKDIDKDEIYKKHGYSVIRIPFFIELGLEEIQILFGKCEAEIASFYSSGFIHKNVVLPASFTERGLKRFRREIKKYVKNENIRSRFWNTLINKFVEKESIRAVLPPSLKFLEHQIKVNLVKNYFNIDTKIYEELFLDVERFVKE